MRPKTVVSVALTTTLLCADIAGPQHQATEMKSAKYFSSSYQSARVAFLEAAQLVGAY